MSGDDKRQAGADLVLVVVLIGALTVAVLLLVAAFVALGGVL